MSDDLLLQEIERLKKENNYLVAGKNSNTVIYGGLIVSTVLTASLQLWAGLVATSMLWAIMWARYELTKPKPPPPKETDVYFVREDGLYNYGVYVRLDNGDKRRITGGFCTYSQAVEQMNWIKRQRKT